MPTLAVWARASGSYPVSCSPEHWMIVEPGTEALLSEGENRLYFWVPLALLVKNWNHKMTWTRTWKTEALLSEGKNRLAVKL